MFNLFKPKRTQHIRPEPIFFHNSLTGKNEEFRPLSEGEVTMYSCGPTVYDHGHIGNLRAYLLPDLIKRLLTYQGYHVEHTINFTDFGHLTDDGDDGEDKMMKALRREGKPITLSAMRDVAAVYMESFKDDNVKLRNIPPTTYTPASDFVEQQKNLIKTLVEKGYAYQTSDGVYFDIAKFPEYGKLGNVDLTKQKDGARIEVNTEKRHPADFALWKRGLLGWESDWGKGFPGWHIECTAMVFATLGKQIDIHTGGEDLKYTHHNGEIAQAEALTGKPYVKYWLHNAHITIDNTKISKSLGNGIQLAQLEDRGFTPETYRYWLLTGHYRSPMNFTFEALQGAKQALYRLKRHIFEEYKNEIGSISEPYTQKLRAALNNDLDTPKTIAIVWELIKDTSVSPGDKVATLRDIDSVLGIGLSDTLDTVVRELGIIEPDSIPEEIQVLLESREIARATRNWEESDRIREAINLKGYLVEDTPTGPRLSHTSNKM